MIAVIAVLALVAKHPPPQVYGESPPKCQELRPLDNAAPSGYRIILRCDGKPDLILPDPLFGKKEEKK